MLSAGSAVGSAGSTGAAGSADGNVGSTGAADGNARSTRATGARREANLDGTATRLAVDATAASPSVARTN